MKKWACILVLALLFSFAFAEEEPELLSETVETVQTEAMEQSEPNEQTETEEPAEPAAEGLQTLSGEEPSLTAPEEVLLRVGDSGVTLDIEFTTNIEKDKVILESSDPKIVSVSGRKMTVKTKKLAEVTITAITTKSGLVAYTHVQVVPKVKSIAFDESVLFLDADEVNSHTMALNVLPEGAIADSVYTTSNPNVIGVNAKTGELELKKFGSATITAKSGKLKASCRVTWMKLAEDTIALEGPEEVAVKSSVKYTAQTANTEAGIVWSLENVSPKSAATIDKKGKLTVSKSGTCTVVAKLDDGSGVFASKDVTLMAKASKVIIKRADTDAALKTLTMIPNGDPETQITTSVPVSVVVSPESASQKIVWTSSNEKVAVFEEGSIVAKGVGKCTVSATAQDGTKKKASVTVTVKEQCEGFYITAKTFKFGGEGQEDYHAYVGKGKKLSLTVTSVNPEAPATVKWSIDPDAKGYITVDGKGVVTGLKPTDGFDAKVIATLQDGTGRKQVAHIEVTKPAAKLTLVTENGDNAEKAYTWDKSAEDTKLKSITLYEEFDSEDVYPFCVWTTSDPDIAEIAYDEMKHCCVVTFPNEKTGKATVTATAMDGSGKKASVVFNCNSKLRFETDSAEIDIAKGRTRNVIPPYNQDATDTRLLWNAEDDQKAVKVISEKKGGIKAIGAVGSIGNVLVQTYDGQTFTYMVRVTKPVSAISIKSDAKTVKVGEGLALRIAKEEGSTDDIEWKSSNSDVLAITQRGNGSCVVTGNATGKATITATLQDGSKVSSQIIITVTE